MPLTAPAPPEAAVGGLFGAGGCSAWWTIVIGPKEPVWRTLAISTMMRPECAPPGTVDEQAERALAQPRARRVAADAGAERPWEDDDHPGSQPDALEQQRPVLDT